MLAQVSSLILSGLFINALDLDRPHPSQCIHIDESDCELVEFGVDSGAAVTGVPLEVAADYPVERNSESAAGVSYRAASNCAVPDEGSKKLMVQFHEAMKIGTEVCSAGALGSCP